MGRLSPCFNCLSEDVELVVSYIIDDDMHHVFCWKCGIAGPAMFTDERATHWWNLLYKNKHLGCAYNPEGFYADGKSKGYGMTDVEATLTKVKKEK